MSMETTVALSLKQPWAALVVAGIKGIEIRSWSTTRRGSILIHAARVPDLREEGWGWLPTHLQTLAQLRGGIVGRVQLVDCIAYDELTTFQADHERHCNEPSWFDPRGMYGFLLANPEPLSFRPYPGWFRFFKVTH